MPAIAAVTGGAPINAGRVRLEVPQVADNGNSVGLKVSVESPMTERDHVRAIHIIAERNPRPMVATFRLAARTGRAEIETRIRLAGSQRVYAIAQMADGSFWSQSAEVMVTLAACIEET